MSNPHRTVSEHFVLFSPYVPDRRTLCFDIADFRRKITFEADGKSYENKTLMIFWLISVHFGCLDIGEY